jgi:translation initiation factor IF-1
MANKEGIMVFDGIVEETLRSSTFRVRVDDDLVTICKLSGKMRQNKIQVLLGDKVKVEISPYDLTKGRIVYRWQ